MGFAVLTCGRTFKLTLLKQLVHSCYSISCVLFAYVFGEVNEEKDELAKQPMGREYL